ncbi:MAG: hypothetical protein IH983_08615 [Planctomycetes bacterium]|nr:hypothetical protein [Planctomycetota bacterium]
MRSPLVHALCGGFEPAVPGKPFAPPRAPANPAHEVSAKFSLGCGQKPSEFACRSDAKGLPGSIDRPVTRRADNYENTRRCR